MTIEQITRLLESWAPPAFQESYDNCGLLTGDGSDACTGIICTLDVTEEVIDEALAKGCNLIVAHHPLIFKGLKKLSGNGYVERTLVKAIRAGIALYALHTSLDNTYGGVSFEMGRRLGLINMEVLEPKNDLLGLFVTYAPVASKNALKTVLFTAGAGQISNYSECSFVSEGEGSYRGNEQSHPKVGEALQHTATPEVKIEVVAPLFLKNRLVAATQSVGFYEEVAWQMIPIANHHPQAGSGCVGELPEPMAEKDVLEKIREVFGAGVVRHTALLNRRVKRMALCGGSGSFLTKRAIAAKTDVFLTADVKYHEFFDADGKILLADIGHYESEQFTVMLMQNFLAGKIPTFAPILLSEVRTNPLFYYA